MLADPGKTLEYRKAFAAFLAAASSLRDLRGLSQRAFERRREDGDDDGRGGNTDLSGFVDAQEESKGAGGHGDNAQGGTEEQSARKEQEAGETGPATGMEKAMNISEA